MSAGPDLERVLTAVYAALDAGAAPDLDALCGGDAALQQRVRRALAQDPDIDSAFAELRRAAAPWVGPGALLGGFRLGQPLGEGGMGRVFAARHERSGADVAVKVQRLTDDLSRLRFQRETEITSALAHPNIVHVHEFGSQGELAWIAMQRLDGPSLSEWSKGRPAAEIAAVGAAVASALHAAHTVGVVHRDVKPANVLMHAGVAYVVDFGLARGAEHTAVTREGEAPGTLAYMAPELLRRDGTAADARSDVYSLGAALYEAVGGVPPFAAATPGSLIRAVLHDEAKPLRLAAESRPLNHILLRALAKEPARRFRSADEMATDLRRFAAGERVRSRRPGWVARWGSRARRHPRLSLTTGLLVVTALVLAGWLWSQRLRAEAVLHSSLADVDGYLDRGELEYARALLAELQRRDPDHVRVADAERRHASRLRLEELLDRIHLAHELTPARRAALLVELDASGAAPLWPEDVAMARLYLRLFDEDRTEARAQYDEFRGRYAATMPVAFRIATAIVDERPPADDLPVPANANDRLAAVTLLRMARVAPAARARLIPLDDVTQSSYRLHFELAAIESAARNHDAAAALWWCAGILRPGRAAPERNRARELMLAREFDAAERVMASLLGDGDVPQGRADARIWCEIAYLRGDVGALEERLGVARAAHRWPDDVSLILLQFNALELRILDGSRPERDVRPEQRALLAGVSELDCTDHERYTAQLRLWRLDASGWDEAARVECLVKVEEALRHVRRAQLLADYHLFAFELCRSQRARAFAHCSKALQLDPGWAEACRLMVVALRGYAAEAPAGVIEEAAHRLDVWRRNPHSSLRPESDLDRYRGFLAGVEFAQESGNGPRLRDWSMAAVEFADRHGLENPPSYGALRQLAGLPE